MRFGNVGSAYQLLNRSVATAVKIKELLDKPEKWTKGFYAKDSRGKPANVNDADAVCFCLEGALYKCCGYNGYEDKQLKLSNSIEKYTNGKTNSLVAFNDNQSTTFEDIKKVLELADV